MWHEMRRAAAVLFITGFILSPFLAGNARAHCDTMDGPVVKDAQKALETGNVNLVLAWVQKDDEGQIKDAFNKTLEVRKLNPQAKELADNYFFETLVRVHRAGEGAPYTGLKPAGTVIDPGLAAADKAIENGSADELIAQLNQAVKKGVMEKFSDLQARKNYTKDNVTAGREYVESYVTFIHYIENMFVAAEKESDSHASEAEATPKPNH